MLRRYIAIGRLGQATSTLGAVLAQGLPAALCSGAGSGARGAAAHSHSGTRHGTRDAPNRDAQARRAATDPGRSALEAIESWAKRDAEAARSMRRCRARTAAWTSTCRAAGSRACRAPG